MNCKETPKTIHFYLMIRPTLDGVVKEMHLMPTHFGKVYEVSNEDGDKYSATVF